MCDLKFSISIYFNFFIKKKFSSNLYIDRANNFHVFSRARLVFRSRLSIYELGYNNSGKIGKIIIRRTNVACSKCDTVCTRIYMKITNKFLHMQTIT